MDVRVRLQRKLSTEELMLLNCGVGGLGITIHSILAGTVDPTIEIEAEIRLVLALKEFQVGVVDKVIHVLIREDRVKLTSHSADCLTYCVIQISTERVTVITLADRGKDSFNHNSFND